MNTMSSSRLPLVDFQHIDHGIGSNSEAFRNSKVLLTGASGFFGTWMLETLVWLNTSKSLNMAIHVVVRNTIAFKMGISSWTESQIKIIEGDLSTLIIYPDTYKYIIHLASDQIRSDDVTSLFNHMSRSVSAANNLIALAKVCETDSILFTSSGAVYSDYLGLHSSGSPFVENIQYAKDVQNEKAIYSETKRYIELLFSTASANLNFKVKIARCFSFIGPFLPLNSNYAIGNFMRDALQGRDIVINGNGKPLRSYMYASDLITFLLLILIKGRSGIPYNVGSPETYSIHEVAKMVRDISGAITKIQILNLTPKDGAGDQYLPDLKNIINEFGLSDFVSLNSAIKKTLDWNKKYSLNNV
jgi:dTDP-glucose 4,6-dehydratase